MKNLLLILCLSFCFNQCYAQINQEHIPSTNIRLSFLLFPFTPLVSVEFRTIGNFTLQIESNFVDTHGMNLKYFVNKRMNEHYVFTGLALVKNELLREDKEITILPYIGYGYAHRFGSRKHWMLDNRIGIGVTTNADSNGIYPILKTGIGRTF